MKISTQKIIQVLGVSLATFLLPLCNVLAQVSVSATAGTTGPTSYSNLSSAFAAVNAGTHQGAVTVSISASFTDAAIAVLNSSGAGSASYTSVLVKPVNDGLTVSYASATGRGMIELNGADNVTIDGDNPGTSGINRNLTFTNTAVNTTTFNSVIRIALSTLITTSNGVLIKNCNINGSATSRSASGTETASEGNTYGIVAGGGASTAAVTTAPSALTTVTNTLASGQTVNGFTVQNCAINACSRGISFLGGIVTNCDNLTITGNRIGTPATTNPYSTVYMHGIEASGYNAATINMDSIYIEGSISVSTAATKMTAIDLGSINASGNSPLVDKNVIGNVIAKGTGGWGTYGIHLNGASAAIIQNNFIARLDQPGSVSHSTLGHHGIRITIGNGHKIYHNTIHLTGVNTGTSHMGTCLFIGANTLTGLDIRNNIFSNIQTTASTNTTLACVAYPTAGASTNNWTINNNAYYQGTNSYNMIAIVGTTFGSGGYQSSNFNPTLTTPASNFRAYSNTLSPVSGNDNSSFAFNTVAPFASATDLHIPAATSTVLESTGASVGVTSDIDSQVRPGPAGSTNGGGLAEDIGADEGDFTPTNYMVLDSVVVTQITAAVPAPSTNQAILRLSVFTHNTFPLNVTTLKFNTSGSTSASNISNAKVFFTGSNGIFNTSIQYGSTVTSPSGTFYINGARALSQGVNYFWLTYDIPGSATVSNIVDAVLDSVRASGTNYAPVDGNPGGARTILGALAGTYNVGTGQTYTTLTAAVADLNVLGVSAPVIFSLTDASYNTSTGETFPIVVNAYNNASPTNSVTIRPATSITSTISQSVANPLIRLNGCKYVIMDGRPGGSGTSKNLIVQNDNTSSSAAAIMFINDATSNLLQYCSFRGANAPPTSGTAGVVVFSTGVTTGNDSNTIDNCDIADGATLPSTLLWSLGSVDGTVAKYNDYNNITNCNLYNFWNAVSGSEANALKLSNGNNYWRVTGNSIYQTAPRSGPAGFYTFNLQNSSNLNALNGMILSDNYIGGSAPQCGGGPWTQTSSAATLNTYFNLGNLSNCKFTRNTHANFSFTTTSTASTGAGLLSIVQYINGRLDIDSNIIGSLTDSNSIVIAGGAGGAFLGFNITASNTAGTYSISGNKFGGIKAAGTGGVSNGIVLISLTTSNAAITYNIDNNILGNDLPNNIIAYGGSAAQNTLGIVFNNATAATGLKIRNNIIRNMTLLHTGSTGYNQAIYSNGGTDTITGNIIYRLYNAASGQANVDASAAVNGIQCNPSTSGNFISRNTIYGLATINTAGSAVINGITLGNMTNSYTSRNFIYSFSTANAGATSSMTGINYTSGSSRVTNNMIRLGIDTTGAAVTNTPIITGLLKKGGNLEAYFNSIYIGGTGAGTGTANTYAYNRTTAGTDIVQNNIFVNERTNTTTGGTHFVVATANNTNLNQNYNVYYTPFGNGDTLGSIGGTAAMSMLAWRSASANDANTSFSNPGFVNPTGSASSLDLHLGGTTAAEAAGLAIGGITDDFDGQTRAGLTPTDIGADAGNFTPLDLVPPSISYTPFGNTLSTTNRTLTATITDGTGIKFTGSVTPRIYFKKTAAGSWSSTAGTYVSGTPQNSIWNFTITNSSMGGVASDDSVYYYIIAQDSTSTPNVGSSPAGVDATDVNTINTHPANPAAYKITPTLSGSFNVGAGQTYTSLTGTNGFFSYMNAAVIGGNITINIVSNITETGAVALNATTETGAGGYRINIVPGAAVERVISGAATSPGLIRLNGADRITVDGRSGGSGRYLKFVNNSTSGPVFNFLNDAHKDTVMYCAILGNNTTTGNVLFSTAGTGGTGNDSNAIMYCYFKDTVSVPTTHVNSSGTSTAGQENSNNALANNEFVNFSANAINITGTGNGDNWLISGNALYQTASRTTAISAILVSAGNGHIIRRNSIGGSAADRSGVPFTNTTSYIRGIEVSVGSGATTLIDTNYFSNIVTTGSAGVFGTYVNAGNVTVNSNIYGGNANAWDTIQNGYDNGIIAIAGGSNVLVQNNLIGNVRYIKTGGDRTSGMLISGAPASLTIRNNVVRDLNHSGTGTTTSTFRPCGIMFSVSTTNAIVENNTIYNINSTNPGTAAYVVSGIFLSSGASGGLFQRNRIYNIGTAGTGTGTSAPTAYGIHVIGTSTANNFVNNQISVGNNNAAQTIVTGILDGSTGSNNYHFNSVFVNGMTSTGANNSYCIQRTSSAAVTTWNNVFYNKRTTGGTGYNYATGSVSAAGITTATSNYNLLVVNDTARVSEFPSSAGYGVYAYNNSLYTPNGTYNTNWIESSSNLGAANLFTDTATGNLGIVTTNPECWYVNGKGIAVAGQSGDFSSPSGVRSVTRAGGTTDIGSVEFNTSTTPPSAIESSAPANSSTTTYTFANRKIASVDWGSSGSVPSTLDVKFYSGVQAPNLLAGKTQFSCYTNITANGGSGYTYDISLLYDSCYLGTVTNAASARMAKYTTFWSLVLPSSVNTVAGTLNSATSSSLNSFSNFTGTDVSNPLPVELLSFTANANEHDVKLDWATASEFNNSGFQVEKSVNGSEFIPVTFVAGNGTSTRLNRYAILDANAFAIAMSDVLYYRLKQLDHDGAFTYSKIVKVNRHDLAQTVINAYPNPSSAGITLSVESPNTTPASVEMIDMNGRSVLAVDLTIVKGTNIFGVPEFGALEPGIYFAKLLMNGETRVIKIAKKN